jgi:LPXTG-motif cell wall-anchored protein
MAKSAITTAIRDVVPQPGATLPYSEFSGFSKVPRLVTKPLSFAFGLILIGLLGVAIKKRKENYR